MWNSDATFPRILEILNSFKRVFFCTLRSIINACIKTLISIPPAGLQTLIELGSGGAKQAKNLSALYFRLSFVRVKIVTGTHERIVLKNCRFRYHEKIGYDFRK